MLYFAVAITFVLSLILTPVIKKFAIRIGALDYPNVRKVHRHVMPRLGGLAIIISFLIGFIVFLPKTIVIWPVLIGAAIITATGILDDIYSLTAKGKFTFQIVAASVTVLGGVQLEFITLPFTDTRIEFGLLAIPITIIWIVAITNAINLIDGLDGLAAGVAAIALFTISTLAVIMGNPLLALIGFLLFGSTLGFLIYNFYPAKIFMGDTGALFLGYMISVISIMGLFKNAAIFSLIVPIIILGVPILDTFFAIIRRKVQKQPISTPDKFHLHHCLIRLGLTHRQTVILIYALSALFGLTAILFTRATMWGSAIIIISLLILVELIVEITGLVSKNYRPLLNFLAKW